MIQATENNSFPHFTVELYVSFDFHNFIIMFKVSKGKDQNYSPKNFRDFMAKHDAGPTHPKKPDPTQMNAVPTKPNLEVINLHTSAQKIKINHSSQLERSHQEHANWSQIG